MQGPFVIAHPLASRDEIAAAQADRHAVGDFPGNHGSIHFVEIAHSRSKRTGNNESHAHDRSAQHLEVDASRLLCNADAFVSQHECTLRIAFFEQAQRALTYFEPRPFGAGRMMLQKAARPLQPAIGNRMLSPESPGVPRQPHGHARRPRVIALAKIQTISTLSRIENEVGEIEPPRSDSQTFQRFRCFTIAECMLESRTRVHPGAPRERFVPGNAFAWLRKTHNRSLIIKDRGSWSAKSTNHSMITDGNPLGRIINAGFEQAQPFLNKKADRQ